MRRSSRLFGLFLFLTWQLQAQSEPPVFSILSVNTWQIPKLVESTNQDRRIQLLADRVLQMRPSVVVLQELWTRSAIKAFTKRVRAAYPYIGVDRSWGRFPLGLTSGLAFFSKYPIEAVYMHHFTHYRGDERFAKKGVLGVKLAVGTDHIFLFTTHMQAGDGSKLLRWLDEPGYGIPWLRRYIPGKKSCVDISLLQVEEMKSFIDKQTNLEKDYVFLTGDFNVLARSPQDVFDPSTPDYDHYDRVMEILGGHHVYDTWERSDPRTKTGSTWDSYGKARKNHRIDYLLSLGVHPRGHSILTDQIGPEVTDHLTVWGEFTFPH